MLQRETVKKKTSIGGQALIEGIMMRGPEVTAMAVRHVSGEIVLEKWKTAGKNRPKVLKFPLIRGVVNFAEAMYFGYKSLMRSAELSGLEDEEEKPKEAKEAKEAAAGEETAEGETSAAENTEPDTKKAEEEKEDGFLTKFGMTLVMVLSAVLGVAIAIGLFMTLPVYLFNLLCKAVPVLNNQIWRAVIEGLMRIVIFVGYILAVSLMKDIHRVFMYHGAEHKTIFCYEKGLELTVENVRKQIRFHPRCGTSFMIFMLLIGIVVSMFISVSNPLLRTGIKLLLIPLIVGIGYEIIKWAGRSDCLMVRIISAPGLWLQRITTKEPTDDMIEVAIESLKAVIPADPEADKL